MRHTLTPGRSNSRDGCFPLPSPLPLSLSSSHLASHSSLQEPPRMFSQNTSGAPMPPPAPAAPAWTPQPQQQPAFRGGAEASPFPRKTTIRVGVLLDANVDTVRSLPLSAEREGRELTTPVFDFALSPTFDFSVLALLPLPRSPWRSSSRPSSPYTGQRGSHQASVVGGGGCFSSSRRPAPRRRLPRWGGAAKEARRAGGGLEGVCGGVQL